MARVLIADDHTLIAEAFQKLLEPACDVVGTVTDGRALISAARDLRPDVIVLDMAMPLLNGLDAARFIKKMDASIKLVFVTVTEDPDIAAAAFRAGRSEEHTSELQSLRHLVCRLLLEKKNTRS